MTISLIAAMANNRVIGKDNQIPWHMPADFSYFKQQTLHKPIIMGRKTYDSLGKPLPNRRNIVITRQTDLEIPGAEVVHSLEAALDLVRDETEVMVIGGSYIYATALPQADRLYITEIDCTVDGDTFFPKWDEKDWQEVSRKPHPADEKNPYRYSFIIYERRTR